MPRIAPELREELVTEAQEIRIIAGCLSQLDPSNSIIENTFRQIHLSEEGLTPKAARSIQGYFQQLDPSHLDDAKQLMVKNIREKIAEVLG